MRGTHIAVGHRQRHATRFRPERARLRNDRTIRLLERAASVGLPHRHDRVPMWLDATVLVAVAHLVAVPEGHALRHQEAAEERADSEDFVADLLEELADLPLRHRAEAQSAHVDELAQVDRHDQVGLHRVREDEARVLGRDLGLQQLPVEVEVLIDRSLEPAGQVVGKLAVRDRVGDRVVVALLEARRSVATAGRTPCRRDAAPAGGSGRASRR